MQYHEGGMKQRKQEHRPDTYTQEADKYRHEREDDRPERDERGVIDTPAVSCVE